MITPFRLSRFYTCRSILTSLQERIGPPTFTSSLSLHAMLLDSGGDKYRCRLSLYLLLHSDILRSWATPQDTFNGAQSRSTLRFMAYNFLCLRLTQCVTTLRPRLSTKCARSTLFRQHFQLLAEVHFRGAPEVKCNGVAKVIDMGNCSPR